MLYHKKLLKQLNIINKENELKKEINKWTYYTYLSMESFTISVEINA